MICFVSEYCTDMSRNNYNKSISQWLAHWRNSSIKYICYDAAIFVHTKDKMPFVQWYK